MKKTAKTTKHKTTHIPKNNSKNIVVGGLLVGFFIFVFLNTVYSQLISPLYTGLVNQNRADTILFLRSIRMHPLFSTLLAERSELFHEDLSGEVNYEKTAREKQITQLKEYLAANPKSPSVLYALSLLYRQEQEQQIADSYLRQAQQIDPLLP